MIARDRDAVEPWHVLGRVGDDVRHDPHARFRRVDIGVADHELLQDVVLDRPVQSLLRDALLLARDDEEGEHGEHRAVHRHADRHLIERDAVEENLHVLDAVDRDAGLADVAHNARMIAVIAAVGGEIEGDREPLLPRGEVAAVEGVGLLGGGEAGILADRPGAAGVHRRAHAAGEGREARKAGIVLGRILGGVERLDLDPFGRAPDEVAPLHFLLGERLPVGEGGFFRHDPTPNRSG